MTRTMPRALAVAVALATTVLPFAARADRIEPVRSGTILGWAYTWPATFSGEARDCRWSEERAGGNPECLTWLMGGCSPALAGRNPASTASIVDVGDLADGSTPWVFQWRTRGPANPNEGVTSGGVVVQMWSKDCTEIVGSKWRSRMTGYCCPGRNHMDTTLQIPRDAKWMTVATNDTTNLEWRLT
jgi:hypothetical protein